LAVDPAWLLRLLQSAGKTKRDFFPKEHGTLEPRLPRLFDQDVENLRKEGQP